MVQQLKKLAALFPERWQSELRRIYFGRQIKRGTFETSEPEYEMLGEFVSPGDWVLDIGANVGHYTKKFSELVGGHGRVIAFEPVPTTFALLAANCQLFSHDNITLINAAASDKTEVVAMALPRFSTGLTNYYQAHISTETRHRESALIVTAFSIDALEIEEPISLVKIDAEGHESRVLRGMQRLLSEHRPILIVETGSEEVRAYLAALGYVAERLKGSPNILFKPRDFNYP